jgi:hypothetical protein
MLFIANSLSNEEDLSIAQSRFPAFEALLHHLDRADHKHPKKYLFFQGKAFY